MRPHEGEPIRAAGSSPRRSLPAIHPSSWSSNRVIIPLLRADSDQQLFLTGIALIDTRSPGRLHHQAESVDATGTLGTFKRTIRLLSIELGPHLLEISGSLRKHRL